MEFETYKKRYQAAYELRRKEVAIVDEAYGEEELLEAFNIYNNHELWYFRAFKPSALAQSNVVFYDYLVNAALNNENIERGLNYPTIEQDGKEATAKFVELNELTVRRITNDYCRRFHNRH